MQLLVSVLVVCFLANVEATTYNIGFLRSPAATHVQAELGALLAARIVNNDNDNFPDVQINFVNRTANSIEEANSVFLSLVRNEDVIGFVGPPLSSWCLVVGVTASNEEIPIISYSATNKGLSDKGVYPYFFRTISSDTEQARAVFDLLEEFDWDEIVIVSTLSSYSVGLTEDFQTFAQQKDIKILSTEFVDSTFSNLDDVIESVRDTGARIILMPQLSDSFRDTIYQAHQQDLTGDPYVYVGMDASVDNGLVRNADGSRNSSLEGAFDGLIATTPQQISNSPVSEDTLEDYLEEVLLRYTTFAFDGMLAFAYALQAWEDNRGTAPAITGAELRAYLRAISFGGLSGRVEFDDSQDRTSGQYSLMNYDKDDEFEEVGEWNNVSWDIFSSVSWPGQSSTPDDDPQSTIEYYDCSEKEEYVDRRGIVSLDSLDASDPDLIDADYVCDGVVDCNNWSDEDFSCSPSLAIAFLIFGILLLILELIIIGCTVAIYKYRRSGRIRATGGFFLYVIAVSCAVGMLTVPTYFGRATSVACVIRYWILFLSACSMTAALFAKEYRVWKVFGNKTLSVISVTQKDLMLIVAAANLPVVLLLSIWSIVDPPTPTLQDVEGREHYVCSTGTTFTIFIAMLLGYIAIMLFISSVMAFRTRKHPSAFSDSQIVGFALYNATFSGVLFAALSFALLSSEPFAGLIFLCIGLLCFFFSTYAILVFPKIYGIFVLDRGLDAAERNTLPAPSPRGPPTYSHRGESETQPDEARSYGDSLSYASTSTRD